MKKNRPTYLCALCRARDADSLCGVIFKETSTLGIRRVACSRVRLDRRFEKVDTQYGLLRVKLGLICSQAVVNVSEYESKQMALSTGMALVSSIWLQQQLRNSSKQIQVPYQWAKEKQAESAAKKQTSESEENNASGAKREGIKVRLGIGQWSRRQKLRTLTRYRMVLLEEACGRRF